ncbi:MAG: hypothetical protein R3B93_26545 [Bacteroidia bacterium]
MDIEVMPDHSVVAIVKADGRGYGRYFSRLMGRAGVAWTRRRENPESFGFRQRKVLWFKTVGDYYGGVYQVEKNAEGEIVVLASVEMNDEYTHQYREYEEYDEEEYDEEEYEQEEYEEKKKVKT